MRFFLRAVLLASVIPQTAAAATIDLYVATTGSDSNPGTQAAPFATLQKAASVATPGVTVHVAPGSYSALTYCSVPSIVAGYAAVCMQTSGTASAPITFISDTKWGAKLTCPRDSGFFVLAASHIIVSGFDMTCQGTANAYGFAGGTFGNNGYNTFSNNYLHDFATVSCPSTGILFGSDTANATWTNIGHNVFDSNVVRHGGSPTAALPHCNQFHGIYTGSPYDVATNNIVSGIIGHGIVAYGGGVCHQTIANNTVFNNSQGGIIAENVGTQTGYADMCVNGGTTDYETITNNISVNNGYGMNYSGKSYSGPDGGVHLYGVSVGMNNLMSNNLAFGNNNFQTLATSPAVVVKTITGSNASVFINYQSDNNWAPASNYNFQNYAERLGSPSIAAGTATGAPSSYDIAGTPRPGASGYDIGAFQTK